MKKGRDIIISANNNEEFIILPIVPDIEVSTPQNNEEFETADQGSLQLIGKTGLRKFSISSIFPCHETPGMRPGSSANPFEYLAFFNKWREEQIPLRMIASQPGGKLWFNMPITIDGFDYHITKAGHIKYSLSVSEYRWYGALI